MRQYLTIQNLKQAAVIGAVVGFMAVPHILEKGSDTGELAIVLLFAVFPLMTVVAGSVTAWGRTGGMVGPFPAESRVRTGVFVAVGVGLLVSPLLFWLDSVLAVPLPKSTLSCMALMLWVAGFETLFFRASTMSFMARVSGRQWPGIVCAVLLRMLVGVIQITEPLSDWPSVIKLVTFGGGTAFGCILFARAGLPAAMAFSAVLVLRVLVRYWICG